MKQEISKSLTFLKLANLIVITGSGITWTGLSYDLAARYEDPRFMALMRVVNWIVAGLSYNLELRRLKAY